MRLPAQQRWVFLGHGVDAAELQLAVCVAEDGHSTGSVKGYPASTAQKTWDILNGLGTMAFAYSFSFVLVEIQVGLSCAARLTDVQCCTSLTARRNYCCGLFVVPLWCMTCHSI